MTHDNDLISTAMLRAARRRFRHGRLAADGLPVGERQKGSDRDTALVLRYPERAKRVFGWIVWPHNSREIAGIRLYLETGDDSQLPVAEDGRALYPPIEPAD